MTDLVCETGLTDEQSEQVLANLGLIGLMLTDKARHLIGDHYTASDAFQDGVFGLARAVQKFEPDRGWKFSTYAMPHIFQSIQRGRGRTECVEYRSAYNANRPDGYMRPLSLDIPTGHDDGGTLTGLADTIPADSDPASEVASDLASSELAAHLRAVCRDDIDRDAVDALVKRCETGATLRFARIGARHGMSNDAVRMRLRQVLERYREMYA